MTHPALTREYVWLQEIAWAWQLSKYLAIHKLNPAYRRAAPSWLFKTIGRTRE